MIVPVYGGELMLVKLTSSTSGEVIMFAEHAHDLLEAIGKECTARGVFTKEQLPDAITALKRAVGEEKQADQRDSKNQQAKAKSNDENEEKEPGDIVALGQRAVPLIRLLERTLKEGGFILWEAPTNF